MTAGEESGGGHDSSRDEFVECGIGGLRLDSSREEFGGRSERRHRDRDKRRAFELLRELPDHGWDVLSGRQLRNEHFDLPRREVRRPFEERLAVVRVYEWHEAREATQVEPAVPQGLQDLRVLACRAGYRNAAVGLGLREMQALGAVGEHRREGLTGEEPSLVDLADVCDEIGLDASGQADELGEATQQLVVGNGTKRGSEL